MKRLLPGRRARIFWRQFEEEYPQIAQTAQISNEGQ